MNLINGTDGDDILNGTDGDDQIFGLGGNDVINAGAGRDFLRGDAGVDTLDGGDGDDVAFFEGVPNGVTIDLSSGVVGNDGYGNQETIVNVESLHGSYHGDSIKLGDNANGYVFGRAGDDTLIGGAGNNNLIGGSGADHLRRPATASPSISQTGGQSITGATPTPS